MKAPSSTVATLALLLGLGLFAGCGGGGSSGGAVKAGSFEMTDVKYGRLIEDGGDQQLYSPLTTVETDPITGQIVPGSLAPIDPTVDVDTLVSMGVGPNYLPRVVPRNGVLMVEFNDQINPNSVRADVLNPDGTIQTAGNIQVRFQKQKGDPDRGVEVELIVQGPMIWVNPVTDSQIGFPASPVDFGPNGEPRADATGYLRLILDNSTSPILSASGVALTNRSDGLGSTSSPVASNPGNEVLDFITQNNLVPTNETFNGFLPDRSQPRIIREYKFTDTIDASDTVGNTSVTFSQVNFSVTASGGLGEWANKQLIVRPGKKAEERHAIISNTAQMVSLATPFKKLPKNGDVVELVRAEFFEPDPTDPIDLSLFDPNNPQNPNNSQLVNFVDVYEIDANADRVGQKLTLRDTIPAYSELSVRFNEAVDRDSLGQWESFRVALNPDPGPTTDERVARLVLSQSQETVTIQPVRENQATGAIQVVGWGPGLQNLQLILTTVPSSGYLQENLSNQDLITFLDLGIRGISDLGGRPLAFPNSLFDPNDPAIRYSEPFFADEALSSQPSPPVSPDMGMIVHRFQGRPVTGIDPATGNPGVKFEDQDNYYLPIADVNLQVNGFLAGPPVVFLTKVHDDFFPPPDGQFGAFPFGTSYPLATFYTSNATPPWLHNGARFQQIWRDTDASPGRDSLQGTLLDLYRVSWAPIGGNVTNDLYEDISIHAGHAFVRPNTNQNGGGASDPNFGLNDCFDYRTYYLTTVLATGDCPLPTRGDGGPNHYDKDYFTVVPSGTQYRVSNSNLYSPPFDGNAYHPWPEFQTAFQYNNGGYPQWHKNQRTKLNNDAADNGQKKPWKDNRAANSGDSLMLEVRIQPQQPSISRQNGFTFAPAVLLDRFPFFRVYSVGASGDKFDPDDISADIRAKCATDASGAGGTFFGDNSRYFAVFDYVKTTSVITSPYVRAKGTGDPVYYEAIVDPPLDTAPSGTIISLVFEGAKKVNGNGGTGFDPDISLANGLRFLGFEVTFVGNTNTLISPNFNCVAVPFLRQ